MRALVSLVLRGGRSAQGLGRAGLPLALVATVALPRREATRWLTSAVLGRRRARRLQRLAVLVALTWVAGLAALAVLAAQILS